MIENESTQRSGHGRRPFGNPLAVRQIEFSELRHALSNRGEDDVVEDG